MKITIESTDKIVTLNGIECGAWEGHTESGIPVHAFVVRVAVAKEGVDHAQFERELRECRPPSSDVAAYPLRMII